jgi:hypothetical protein
MEFGTRRVNRVTAFKLAARNFGRLAHCGDGSRTLAKLFSL